ncbi:MAG TPA: hypothetical protein VF693_08660 [Allosphingosinicella sp.]|jgi:hypothetical protein
MSNAMTDARVNIHLPGQPHPLSGRLLAQVEAEGALPLLQLYDCGEYLLAVKRLADQRVEHERIWISDDQFDGRCHPVHPLPEDEVRDQLRRFFGDDPRAPALIRDAPLR